MQKTYSFTVSAFTLPSTGYQWIYNNAGQIMGEVTVGALDSDGFYHEDHKQLTYSVANPYPMDVFYQNQTVNSAKPTVQAHNSINLSGDQFSSGANITFKSGNVIFIEPNTLIQNGSVVDIKADPSLR